MASPATTRASAVTRTRSAASLQVQTLGALLLGLAILFAAGFVPTGAAHNAAHDERHSLAVPCH